VALLDICQRQQGRIVHLTVFADELHVISADVSDPDRPLARYRTRASREQLLECFTAGKPGEPVSTVLASDSHVTLMGIGSERFITCYLFALSRHSGREPQTFTCMLEAPEVAKLQTRFAAPASRRKVGAQDTRRRAGGKTSLHLGSLGNAEPWRDRSRAIDDGMEEMRRTPFRYPWIVRLTSTRGTL
jgi:hypothetical protein